MTELNMKMKKFLFQNGINCMPKYIKDGSMRGTWRLYNSSVKWWGNKELQERFKELGFVDFDGDDLDDYSGNGGMFSIFARLEKKEDAPEYGKQYALTGATGSKCIANGNSWRESEVV